jgi:hypothetical protein
VKSIKKLPPLFLIVFVAFSLILTNVVKAGTTDGVAATVTVQNISVSVTDGNVTYGTLAVNTSRSTLSAEENEMQTATNDGNLTANFNIMGQDSTDWELANTNGVDQYTHFFCNETDNDCASPPTSYTALTEDSYTALDTGVASSGTVDFQLRITTPTSSTVYTQQSVDVTVQAVAGS